MEGRELLNLKANSFANDDKLYLIYICFINRINL